MNKMNLKYGLVALAGLGLSANVSATDLTCSDITFTPEAYEAYEFVDQACLDMVTRDNGLDYAKLTARIVAQTPSGTHLRFRHADGELGPSNRYNPKGGFHTGVAGETVDISKLAVRSDFNLYIPAAYWSVPVVEVTKMTEAAAPPPPPPPPAPEPEPEPEPEMLPTTASSLPLLALFGSLLLVLGGALRLSRR